MWLGASVPALLLAVWGVWSYRPPLLDPGSRNPPERIVDFFAYSWLYSKALWLENTRRPEAADAAALSAAWFRPALLSSRFHLDPADPQSLASEFEQRGLNAPAGRLLQLAAFRTADPARLSGILSSVAALSEWERLIAILDGCDRSLLPAANGDYWRGRALIELGRSAEAVPYLSPRRRFRSRRRFLSLVPCPPRGGEGNGSGREPEACGRSLSRSS